MKDERLIEAFNAWEELSQTPDTIIAYQSRLKTIIDEEAKLDYAEYKGIEKGREEGIKQGLKQGIEQGIDEGIKKVAMKMIAKGKSNEEIMDATDLTLGDIEKLRN